MDTQLKIQLFPGWQLAENKGGPATYLRGASCLQFSRAQNSRGPMPIDAEGLIGMCEKLTRSMKGRRNVLTGSGQCSFGTFGTLVAQGDFPAHMQAWVLTDGTNFILVTHVCEKQPSAEEIEEAKHIALMTTIA